MAFNRIWTVSTVLYTRLYLYHHFDKFRILLPWNYLHPPLKLRALWLRTAIDFSARQNRYCLCYKSLGQREFLQLDGIASTLAAGVPDLKQSAAAKSGDHSAPVTALKHRQNIRLLQDCSTNVSFILYQSQFDATVAI